MKLSHKFFVMNVFAILTAIAVTSAWCLFAMKGEFKRKASVDMDARMKTFHEMLKSKGEGLTLTDGRLAQGAYVLNANFELPDKLKALFGGAATIFMGDVRVSTNVMTPEGARAVGTKLTGPAYDAVIREGKPFRGEAAILGVPYFTAYDPLKNAAGEVIGVLYVGEKQSEYLAVYDTMKYAVLIVALVLAAALSGLTFFMVRKALRPLGRMVAMMRDIAQGEGDLTARLDIEARDEIGEAADCFNRFVDKLHGVMSNVSGSAHQVAQAAAALHDNVERISSGTQEVASQTTSVATAGEEMSATATEIAGNCLTAAEGANQASETANEGAVIVRETITVMNRIAERVRESAHTVESLGARSDQIGEIVRTIEDIADQTNLLALNAAIEAARAGDMGRGFAVVADEVRALAERTTAATREIGAMIKTIQQETGEAVASMHKGVDEVEQGTMDASRSGEALEGILGKIDALNTQIGQIATAAEQQTATTSEISHNIHGITEIINRTAEGTRETAAAATQLEGLADQLHEMVGRFRLAS